VAADQGLAFSDKGAPDHQALTYTVRAYEVSPKDGSITHVDDKAFTVN